MTPPPKGICIGPFHYTVNIDWQEIDKQKRQSGDTRLGSHDADDLIISLDTRRPRDVQADTILHECLHAIWTNAYLGDNQDSERIISAFGVGLLMLLRDNPALIAFVTEL